MRIVGVVHTRNSARTLDAALRSLAWTDEIVVADMESEDGTREIARRHGARLVPVPVVPRVDGVRNRVLEGIGADWIFVLDSDESLAGDAAERVRALIEAHGSRYDAFGIPRFNTIAGRIMRGSGWYPDHQVRLFRPGTVQWSDSHHAPPEVVTGRHRRMDLRPPDCLHIHHLNYDDLRHFVRKQVEYALGDRYDDRPGAFDFSDYVARAHATLALRDDTGNDGDLSHALALLLAWDQIVRGLVHWDSLDPRPPLSLLAALPAGADRVPRRRIRLRRWLARHPSAAHHARRLRRFLRL